MKKITLQIYRMTGLAILAVSLWTTVGCQNTPAPVINPNIESQDDIHIDRWLHVQAPEFVDKFRQLHSGPKVRIQDYRGKRLLLWSVDVGDWRKGDQDFDALKKMFESVNKALEETAKEGRELSIIILCDTLSFRFGMEGTENWQVEHLAKSPILDSFHGMTQRGRDQEPYAFLVHGQGGILIDRNGKILHFFKGKIGSKEIREAAMMSDCPIDKR